MSRYTSPSLPSITPLFVPSGSPGLDAAIADPGISTLGLPGDEGGAASFTSGDATSLSAADMQDQFFVFQLSTAATDPTILESTQVNPSIEGGADNPDVLAHVEMVSFHLGANEAVRAVFTGYAFEGHRTFVDKRSVTRRDLPRVGSTAELSVFSLCSFCQKDRFGSGASVAWDNVYPRVIGSGTSEAVGD